MSSYQEITATIFDRKGRILSFGKNSYIKTHTLQAHHAKKVGMPEKVYLHAEVHAIVKCRELKKAHSILITRFDRYGQPANAKPCPICQSAIKEAGIHIIQHT